MFILGSFCRCRVFPNSWSCAESAVNRSNNDGKYLWPTCNHDLKFWQVVFPIVSTEEELNATRQAGILFSCWLCTMWMQWLHCAWRWIFLMSDLSRLKYLLLIPSTSCVFPHSQLTWPLPGLTWFASLFALLVITKPTAGESPSLPLQGNVSPNTHLL